MYTNRVVDTCYTAGFMLTLFALFFGGPDMWPNKRARMYYGYVVFLAALVLPTLVSTVLASYA
jgi:predicted membrane channel-forming protein YqfA (hemolysin III family)